MMEQTLPELKNRVTGEVVLPDSPNYDEFRNSFAFPGSPAVIVRPRTTEDVAAAIHYAKDSGLTLSIRSGGHSMTGMSTNVGGLVIDLSHFNAVELIDPARHTVRIGAGAKWGDAAVALAEHGLALSSGDTNSVGVGGLTLGGGIGWLVRKYGLTIDSLEAAEIVTADGRALRVSADQHPDLFWALRGGGGNFGVVTSFEFRAQPLTSVFGGLLIFDLAEAEKVLTGWAEYMRRAPEELNSTAILFSGFGPQVPPALMVYVVYGGDDEAAATAAIQPLLEIGNVLNNDVKRKPYYEMLEDAPTPPGIKAQGNNGFIKSLDRDVIAALAANYGQPNTPMVQIRSLGGAMARVKPDATAFPHRDYEAFVLAASLVPQDMPDEQARNISQAGWNPIKGYVTGTYINFLTDIEARNLANAYPGDTYTRLAQVKAAYDPDNLFNRNLNIKPE